MSRHAEDYIRISRALINQALEEQKWLIQSRETWLYADCVFFMPDRIVRDSHNMLKLLMDVMQGKAFVNDYFVMPRIQYVGYDKENPRVEVVISVQDQGQIDKALKIIGASV